MRNTIIVSLGVIAVVVLGVVVRDQFAKRERMFATATAETQEAKSNIEATIVKPEPTLESSRASLPVESDRNDNDLGVEEELNQAVEVVELASEAQMAKEIRQTDSNDDNMHAGGGKLDLEVEERIDSMMKEMDTLVQNLSLSKNPEDSKNQKLAIEELEEEIRELLKEAKIPSVSREGPEGWTIYSDSEEESYLE